jgi:redox-sensitive bicupin YhaK (pirin superfamily)
MKIVEEIFPLRETMEGAGVRLHRGFANGEIPRFDPFLLFDDFSSKDPKDYLLGFPWHPHRGIETVTYILNGEVLHHDSIGNSGTIGKGQVQWMTAGSGILHEEMPKNIPNLQGFQLWINLPKKDKMTAPRYQDVSSNMMPVIPLGDGVRVRVIAGSLQDVQGPVQEIMAMPLYLDIEMKPGSKMTLPIPEGYNTCAYIIEGNLGVDDDLAIRHKQGHVLLFSRTPNDLVLVAGSAGARFLLMSGKPLNEPVAWAGPIVMNTQQELEQAYYDLKVGSFIKPVL